MNIRPLQRSDYDAVCELMIEFARNSGVGDLNKETYDWDYAKNVLLRCEKTGASFVAQAGDDIVGIILSMRVQELWIPTIIRLRELAWYVREEYRNTTVGARLFAAYKNAAENLRNQGKITGYTMTKLHNSDNFDYERRGFKFIESTYMVGA